jgi:hypothetical protein
MKRAAVYLTFLNLVVWTGVFAQVPAPAAKTTLFKNGPTPTFVQQTANVIQWEI